jgi:hypothetical protein
MNDPILKKLEKDFHDENFDCSVITEQDESSLIVYLGNDANDRERILNITHTEQPIQTEQDTVFHKFQFRITLPFEVKSFTINDLNSAISFFNTSLDLPGFEFHEIDNKVVFRYVLLSDGIPAKTLFMGVSGIILLNIDLLSETFEKVASGKITFYELLKTASDTIKNL